MFKILLVDDEPMVGKRLKPTLEKRGYEVEFYDDPARAVARLGEQRFDVVVTDMRMGELSGLQVLEAALGQHARTKVILISGYATIELAREVVIKGAFDVIAKPFKPSDLRRVIEKACKAITEENRSVA